jgi:hypothetical protein
MLLKLALSTKPHRRCEFTQNRKGEKESGFIYRYFLLDYSWFLFSVIGSFIDFYCVTKPGPFCWPHSMAITETMGFAKEKVFTCS